MAAQISDPTISWGVDDNFLSNEYTTVWQLLSSNLPAVRLAIIDRESNSENQLDWLQRGRMVKTAAIVIDLVTLESNQNLLASFFCDLEKSTLRHSL